MRMAIHKQQEYLSLRKLLNALLQSPVVKISRNAELSCQVYVDIHKLLGMVNVTYGDILGGLSEVPSSGNILYGLSMAPYSGVSNYGLSGVVADVGSSEDNGISLTGYFGNEYDVSGGGE